MFVSIAIVGFAGVTVMPVSTASVTSSVEVSDRPSRRAWR
jgi:hypothetical protein